MTPPLASAAQLRQHALRKMTHICWLNDVQKPLTSLFFPLNGCDLGLPSLIPLCTAHNPPPPLSHLLPAATTSQWVHEWKERLSCTIFPPLCPKRAVQKGGREEGGLSIHSLPSQAEYPALCHGCFRVTFSNDLHMRQTHRPNKPALLLFFK